MTIGMPADQYATWKQRVATDELPNFDTGLPDVPPSVPGEPSGYNDVLARLGITPTPGMESGGPPAGFAQTAPPLLGGQGKPGPAAEPLGSILGRLGDVTGRGFINALISPGTIDPETSNVTREDTIRSLPGPLRIAAENLNPQNLLFGLPGVAAGAAGQATQEAIAPLAARTGKLETPINVAANVAGGIGGFAAAKKAPQILNAIDESLLMKLPGSSGIAIEEATKVGSGGLKPRLEFMEPNPPPYEPPPTSLTSRLAEPATNVPAGTLSSGVDNPLAILTQTEEPGLSPAGRIAAAIQRGSQMNQAALHQLRQQQYARYTERLAKAGNDPDAISRASAALQGLAERPGDIAPLSQFLSEEAYNSARVTIAHNLKGESFSVKQALTALDDLYLNGHIQPPRPGSGQEFSSNMLALFKGLGQNPDTEALKTAIRGVSRQGAMSETLYNRLVDIAGIPRTALTATDLSAPMRQGMFLGPGHPKEWASAWKPMVEAFGSKEAAQAVDDAIRSGPYAQLWDSVDLYRAPLDSTLTNREEAIISRALSGDWSIAGKGVPNPIAASQRAFVTFMNKLRTDVANVYAAKWDEQGTLTLKRAKSLADYINVASGRGNLGSLEPLGNALNVAFFSPRFLASRFQTFGQLIAPTTDNAVRMLIARDLAASMGLGSALLGLASLGGLATVNLDPRSSDFAKAKIGKMRIDPWAGYQQLVRYSTQFLTQKSVSGSGFAYDTPRGDVLLRFLLSKQSPAFGLGTGILQGQTFTGEPIKPDWSTVSREAWNLFVPMWIQDMRDAFAQEGIGASIAGGIGSFTGVGVQTYGTLADKLNEAAGGKDFYRLEPSQQQAILAANLDLAQAKAENAGPETKAANQYRADYATKQAALDAQLTAGQISPGQWRDQRSSNMDFLSGQLDVLYAGKPAKPEADKTPVDRFYDAKKKATDTSGAVDWDKVDAWVASQSAPDQAYIKRNTGLGGTPEEQRYRATTKALADAGLFDIRDNVMQQFAPAIGVQPGKANDVLNSMRQQLLAQGNNSVMVDLQMNRIEQLFDRYVSVVRLQWEAQHPDLARYANAWGFISTSKRNAGILMGATQ